MLIDPPSPFAPAEEWRAFLNEMEGLEPRSPDDAALVRRCIKLAKQALSIPLDEPRSICPACKQRHGVNIIFGMPTEELWEAEKRGEVVLGGCCLPLIGDPERQCLACGHQWQIARRPRTPQ